MQTTILTEDIRGCLNTDSAGKYKLTFTAPNSQSITTTKSASKKKTKKKKNKSKSEDMCDGQIPSNNSSWESSYEDAEKKSLHFVNNLGSYSDDQIQEAARRIRDSSRPFSSYALMTEIDLLEKTAHIYQGANNQCLLHEDGGIYSSDDESLADSDTEDLVLKAIQAEKNRFHQLIEGLTIKCQVCSERRATVLLLPCGHLASCQNCLMDVRRCPFERCNKVVRGTKEVFFA